MNGLQEKAMIKQKDFLYILILLIFGMTSCLSNEQSSSSKIEKSQNQQNKIYLKWNKLLSEEDVLVHRSSV